MESRSLNFDENNSKELDFARENISDAKRVKQWEKAHKTYNLAVVMSIPTVIVIYLFQNYFLPPGNIIATNFDETLTAVLGLFILIAYLARRARLSTDLARDELTIHYLSRSIISYHESDYSNTSKSLFEFQSHAKMNSVTIFSDKAKDRVSDYTENLDEKKENQQTLSNSFEEFSSSLVDILISNENFEHMSDMYEEDNGDDVDLINDVILEGLGTFPIDRYLTIQIIIIVAALTVFYTYSQQLGMFIVVSLLPIAQRLKDRE